MAAATECQLKAVVVVVLAEGIVVVAVVVVILWVNIPIHILVVAS